MTGPGVHSEHGASSAYRWTACPGSVVLSRGIPRRDTDFSREGTAAHALAELAYKRVRSPDLWLGMEVEGVIVSDDMVEAVQVYLDYLNNLIELDDVVRVEHRVSLEKLNPPAPMFGTCDCLIYRRSEKKLFVIDYKHGQGVPVDAKGNKQLRYYALGAMLSLDDDQPVETVEAVIVQPRAAHQDGPIRSDIFSAGDLLDFSADLIDAVKLSLEPDAPLKAGSHCKFCPASARCPARKDHAMEVAQVDFATEVIAPPDPRLLPIEQVGNLLTKIDLIEDWASSLRAFAKEQLEKGHPVPGWKLVQKRPVRKWAEDESVIVSRLIEQSGIERDALFNEPELKTPAQIEKIVTKKRFPSDLVVSVSSGLTLAPEHDKRPAAAVDAASEFAALTVEK